ncbi:hypothetical protein H8356DRAFT_1435482 [Neocallimastix lanati (nom. inval.)]|nr:hypothetical protein H8356DRAFT_1435482 [Neocallimastix sp. JGI-2020a]
MKISLENLGFRVTNTNQLKFNLVIDKNYFNSILIIKINTRNIKELEAKGKTTITQQIMEILYRDFQLKLYSLESYDNEILDFKDI